MMLAKSGATVVMSDLAESFMAETCKLMDETGAEYHCVYGDLSKVENAQRVVTETKNIHKLMQYADQLRVKPKVLRYMEVLLMPRP
ncbi:MAG: hypothetical protein V8S99_08510 [Oscillospiraceae bacterium]